MGATYRPGIVGTWPSVIPPVMVDGSNSHRGWPGVSPGIIRYSFTDLGGMDGWVGIALRGGREIYWYGIHGVSNTGRWHGSTMVNPLCYSHLLQMLRVYYSTMTWIKNTKLSGYYFYINTNIKGYFQICISVALNKHEYSELVSLFAHSHYLM